MDLGYVQLQSTCNQPHLNRLILIGQSRCDRLHAITLRTIQTILHLFMERQYNHDLCNFVSQNILNAIKMVIKCVLYQKLLVYKLDLVSNSSTNMSHICSKL
jgi:hypothetical protein